MGRPDACPDGGTCHHDCLEDGACFRVLTCEPFTGAFEGVPDGVWPLHVVLDHENRRVST